MRKRATRTRKRLGRKTEERLHKIPPISRDFIVVLKTFLQPVTRNTTNPQLFRNENGANGRLYKDMDVLDHCTYGSPITQMAQRFNYLKSVRSICVTANFCSVYLTDVPTLLASESLFPN